jgi:3-methyl-2-oxobutanoate hydroxymethyltransferase
MATSKLSIADLMQKKARGEKITMLTAYDYPFAALLDEAGIDMILVGDSAANVVLGYPDTLPVTMDELLVLTRAAARAVKRGLVIGDMPFGSYNVSVRDAIRNGNRFIKEARVDGVKLEGGGGVIDTVRALVQAGIPTVGHLGLTPQTAGMLGGYRVQARTAESAARLIDDAHRLQEAGVFCLVVECIPDIVARALAGRVRVPVIGIGAGPHCDGQVLVLHDLLGIKGGFEPKFVKKYADLGKVAGDAVGRYREEVESGAFPAEEHIFTMPDEEAEKFMDMMKAPGSSGA